MLNALKLIASLSIDITRVLSRCWYQTPSHASILAFSTPCNAKFPGLIFRPLDTSLKSPRSNQIKIIQLLPISQDVPLDLRIVDPRHKIFDVASHHICWVRDVLCAYTYVALLNQLRGGLHGFGHPIAVS